MKNREIFQEFLFNLNREQIVRWLVGETNSVYWISSYDFPVAYGYSSDVLGFIVEKISGKTLDEYM